MSKVKCHSVRLESLVSISEKAYKATAFDGTTAIIPKSQVFGPDYEVEKSDAYWISAWILEQKNLQYSSKKTSFFDKDRADYQKETGIEIERFVPEEKEPVETTVPSDLERDEYLVALESFSYSGMADHSLNGLPILIKGKSYRKLKQSELSEMDRIRMKDLIVVIDERGEVFGASKEYFFDEKTRFAKIIDAVKNKTAQILTLELAESLKGKRIQTMYFGYKGQNGMDEFVVGDVIEREWIPDYEPRIKELKRDNGTDTFIRLHFMLGNDFFSCSDSDRAVYFVEV